MANFVIIALGSNLRNRPKNISDAYFSLYNFIKIKSISPLYKSKALLPENAPSQWDIDFYNSVLYGETELSIEDLHKRTKQVEASIGKDHSLAGQWAPRIIDIDIIAFNDQIIKTNELTIPHSRMLDRDFVVLPLNDILPEWRHPKTDQKINEVASLKFFNPSAKKLTPKSKTKIQGILNITPDSFSDGGKFYSVESAKKHLNKLIDDGADVIDIGAESTRPNAETITVEDEWKRLLPVMEIIKDYPDIEFSLDSRNPENQLKALSYGVSIINDVCGFESQDMIDLASSSGKKIIFMHSLSIPADKNLIIPESEDPVLVVYEWAESKIKQLVDSGVNKSQIIFDPGIGFGKNSKQSWDIIQRVDKFKELGVEILIGHSEKSFLTLFTDKAAGERLNETLIISKILMDKDIDYLRVHNVKSHKELLNV